MYICILCVYVRRSVYMDMELFVEMLGIDSTSGKEAEFADFLSERLLTSKCRVDKFEVGDGTKNLLFSWGEPKVVFCSHLDTVPPYIPPTYDGTAVHGRGSCDAKGQIFSMYEACKVLESEGYEGFGLLLLAGEETGSFGAKAFREQHPGAEWVIVGEPTDNCMASASKGTKAFEVTFEGKAFHSGYPQYGVSAVELFNDFMNALRSIVFPKDDILGDTTWNVGKLVSDNPQNILSDRLTCRVYFRTTFESDVMVSNVMKNIAGPQAKLRFGKRTVLCAVNPYRDKWCARSFGNNGRGFINFHNVAGIGHTAFRKHQTIAVFFDKFNHFFSIRRVHIVIFHDIGIGQEKANPFVPIQFRMKQDNRVVR